MKYAIWQGEPQNLGRFHWVEKGSPLVLTDVEYEQVKKDKRFKFVADAEKLEEQESNPALDRANDLTNVALLELGEKSRADLLKFVEELRAEGKVLVLSKNPTKAELLRVLKPFVENPVSEPAEANGEEVEETENADK